VKLVEQSRATDGSRSRVFRNDRHPLHVRDLQPRQDSVVDHDPPRLVLDSQGRSALSRWGVASARLLAASPSNMSSPALSETRLQFSIPQPRMAYEPHLIRHSQIHWRPNVVTAPCRLRIGAIGRASGRARSRPECLGGVDPTAELLSRSVTKWRTLGPEGRPTRALAPTSWSCGADCGR
jgi:hypothetical protein